MFGLGPHRSPVSYKHRINRDIKYPLGVFCQTTKPSAGKSTTSLYDVTALRAERQVLIE